VIAGRAQVDVRDFRIGDSLHQGRAGCAHLAVTTAQRSPSVPELPTVAEAGAESGLSGFRGGHLARGGGAARDTRLFGGTAETSTSPRRSPARDLRERLESLGAELAPGTPQDFADYIAREIPKWAKG